MNPDLILRMLGIDKSKLPSTEQITDTFDKLRGVTEQLDRIEHKLNIILNNGSDTNVRIHDDRQHALDSGDDQPAA